jgi:M6 family metalloprotease-like protein
MKRKAILVIICLLSFFKPVSALQPPTTTQLEKYRRDGTLSARIANAKALRNHIVSETLVARAHYKLKRLLLQSEGIPFYEINQILAPPPAWRGMPTSGTVKVLALLIAFSDYPSITSAATIQSKLFGDGSGGYPYESLRNYYRRSSYNKLEILGNVLGWYTTGYPRSDVPQTTQGRENLIKEALNYYDGLGHDFTQYDNNGDGTIDYLIVIWAGPHGEWASFWWGYMTTFSDSTYRLDGKRLRTYSWQWELYNYPNDSFDTKGVIHETGHALGLPDYYDYDDTVGPKGGVGGLDMMDGNWGDHNCFSKFLLDWINPPVHKIGLRQFTLNPSGTTEDALVVMPGAMNGNQFFEFFMIQNRSRIGNDITYPNDGLLIWHVDSRLNQWGTNFLYDNSFTEHKLLRLMEADGLEEIETGDGRADAGDYYIPGKTFGPDTIPNSHRYNWTFTGIRVKDISASGNLFYFSLFIPARMVDFDGNSLSDLTGITSLGSIYYTADLQNWANVSGILSLLVIGDFDGDGISDLAGTALDGSIWITTDLLTWMNVPGGLSKLVVGDFNNDGRSDLAGLTIDGLIFYTTDLQNWTQIPGVLDQLVVGDFDGDGYSDLAGLALDRSIWVTTNLLTWMNIPGQLKELVVGDFNNDGFSDLAGLTENGLIFYTTDLQNWTQIPGVLDQLVVGDFNNDGRSDLAGLVNGLIFYTTDLQNWNQIPGLLHQLVVGDFDGDGASDLAGLTENGLIFYTTDLRTWTQIPGVLWELAQ